MNENEKLSLEQFGAQIRLKHPEYLKYSNKEIAERTVQKYPQYKANISDLPPEEKKKGIFRKIGDFFTSGTQRFGADIGQTIASDKEISRVSQAEQLSSDIELNLIKTIGEQKAAGKDTSRLEKELVILQGRQGVGSRIKEVVPVTGKSNKQVIGGAIETGLEALSGGIIGGIKGFGLKKLAATSLDEVAKRAAFRAAPLTTRLGGIAKETALDTAKLLPFGYSFDIAKNLQEDKTGASLFKPGLSTAVSAIIPVGIGGIRAGRQVAGDTLSRFVAPNISGVPGKAYERLRTGDATKFIGKTTPESALNEARASASAFKSAMQREFGAGKEDAIVEFTGKRIGIDEKTSQKLAKIAERFGFDDRMPQNLRNMSVKETIDLLTEINSVGIISKVDDPLVRSLKLGLAEIKDDIKSRAEAQFGGKGGTFDRLYTDYSVKSGKLTDIQSIIGKVGLKPGSVKLTPVQEKTLQNRFTSMFNSDNEGYLKAMQVLEDETGQPIIDKAAAALLSEWAGRKGTMVGSLNAIRGGIAGAGFINPLIPAVLAPFFSPRAGAWLIRKIGGYDESLATRLLNAAPSVRTAIYNAVNKENMAFDDAVKLYAREYIENPRLGLSIEDVTKRKSFQGNDLTTKILKDLEGKTTVSKQYILDATNRGELKQVERDLIRQILNEGEDIKVKKLDEIADDYDPTDQKDIAAVQEFVSQLRKGTKLPPIVLDGKGNVVDGFHRLAAYRSLGKKEIPTITQGPDTINVADFSDRVKAELLPLKVAMPENNYRYESITLPDDLRGSIDSYYENIYNSPVKTSAGQTHFSGATDNYFGHTRIEDMADNKTRRVIEVQSDLYQKGNLEKEFGTLKSQADAEELSRLRKEAGASNANEPLAEKQKSKQKLAQYSNPTAHFRMVREELKKAAQDGKTKLQFPTGETAMKIEGLGTQNNWRAVDIDNLPPSAGIDEGLKPEWTKVGMEVTDGNGNWIITDVLGEGKFKAVPKSRYEIKSSEFMNEKELTEMKDAYSETFDISGKVDTNNPIYKFYEKDLRKYLAKFGSNRVVDANGVSWIEVPIKKEYGTNPVEAFGKIGMKPLTIGAASAGLGVLLGKQKEAKEVEKQ
jgi:hypothetical protein